METWQLELMAEMLNIYATIEAMKAENMNRTTRGETIAYTEGAFMDEASRATEIKKKIIKLTECFSISSNMRYNAIQVARKILGEP